MDSDAPNGNRLSIVSADGHAGAPPEIYRNYIDPSFRSAIDDLLVEGAEWNRLTNHQDLAHDDDFPGWSIAGRLRALDAEGIALEVVHPGVQGAILPFFAGPNRPCEPERQTAGCRAYNRWLADWMDDSDGRIVGVAQSTCFDVDAAVADLRWAAERGFVAAMLPQTTFDPDLPPLFDAYYEPFWAACEELGLRLALHAGWGIRQGRFWEFSLSFVTQVLGRDLEELAQNGSAEVAALVQEALAKGKDSPLALTLAPRRALWQLMVGGVLDRHPSLTIVVTELRADWVPATFAALDERCRQIDAPMDLLPSEYWARNCFVTPSSIHRSEVEMREDIGLELMMFGSDCPHPEATYPHSREWLRDAFGSLTLDELTPILADNAIRAYGLDRALVDRVAATIGPTPEEILGGEAVDADLIADFHRRAGYLRPAESVRPSDVLELLDADLIAVDNRDG